MSEPLPAVDLGTLVGLILEGDASAESLLVQHFTPRVRAMAVARVRNPDLARDLTQETLVEVLQAARRGQIRDHERLAAFVHGVARNLINNFLRRRQEHPEIELNDEAHGLTVEQDHVLGERRALIARAMHTLGPLDRQVLLLTLVDGLKPAQIAERTGSTPEAIRTRKTRALKRILDRVAELSRPASPYHSLKGTDQL